MRRNIARGLIGVGVFFLGLQLLYVVNIRFPFEPAPFDVVGTCVSLVTSGEIWPDVFSSSIRVFVGVVLAALIAVPLGILLAWKQNISPYINPVLELIRPIPPIAWIPIAILTFGIGDVSAYFIVFIGAFFPLFSNAYFGARSLPKVLRHTCQSYGINGLTYLYKVLFHYSLPNIFTGLKVAVGMAWMSVIAAELAGVQGGLGYFIQYNRLLLRIDYVIAGMIYIGLIGTAFSILVMLAERLATPWRFTKNT